MLVRYIRRDLHFRRIHVRLTTVHGESSAYVRDFRVTFRCRIPAVLLNVLIARLCRLLGLPLKVSIRRQRQRFTKDGHLFNRTRRGQEVLTSAVRRRQVFGLHYRFASGVGKLYFRFLRVTRFVFFFRCVLFLLGS